MALLTCLALAAEGVAQVERPQPGRGDPAGRAAGRIAGMQPGHWLELPGTRIRSVLPDPLPKGSPRAIVIAWNGAAMDTRRSRLIVWGGGHADYFGNEIYAIDVGEGSVLRLTDPSPKAGEATCTSALPDGTPTSRHTYGGLAYMAKHDRLFAVTGSLAPCGHAAKDAWAYDFTLSRWERLTEDGPVRGYGIVAAYDEAADVVYIKDRTDFYAYSPSRNRFTRLNRVAQPVDYHLSATIDTKRRLFVMVGDGVQVIDLGRYRLEAMQTTNPPAAVTGKQSPGVAYDPVADRIVLWHGGDQVYALNMDTREWTQVATGPGPSPAAPVQGTFGRWAYVPEHRVFVIVNDVAQNAWLFRLSR